MPTEVDKKYELVESQCITLEDGRKLYRIKALKDISDRAKAGYFGGFIEKESNLSQEGSCFIYDESIVMGDAVVSENAVVSGRSLISGSSKIYGNAEVRDIHVFENAEIYDDASVSGVVNVAGDVKLHGDISLCGDFNLHGNIELVSVNDYMKCSPFGVLIMDESGEKSMLFSAEFYRSSDNTIVCPVVLHNQPEVIEASELADILRCEIEEDPRKESLNIFVKLCDLALETIKF